MQNPKAGSFDAFAITLTSSWMRLLAAMAVKRNMKLDHSDIQAFAEGLLREEVYMKLPPWCDDLAAKLLRLDKSVCGLKQASHEFHELLTSRLTDYGFEQCLTHTCVFRESVYYCKIRL